MTTVTIFIRSFVLNLSFSNQFLFFKAIIMCCICMCYNVFKEFYFAAKPAYMITLMHLKKNYDKKDLKNHLF